MALRRLLTTAFALTAVAAQDYTYKNPRSTPYLIDALPDVDFDLNELYGGSVAINESEPSRTLYFLFKPAHGNKTEDLTIWLDGGPGCSSMGAFFTTNGPINWQSGTGYPRRNPYSWAKHTNMLWVDNPVSTGFTEGKVTARNEKDVARDFLGFLENWEKIFGVRNYRIFLTGESYAGRYVPYISAAMLDRDDKERFDVRGNLMYSPAIGDVGSTQRSIPRYEFVRQNNNILNLAPKTVQKMERLHNECGYGEYLDKYLRFPPESQQPTLPYPKSGSKCDLFSDFTLAALTVNPCFNANKIVDQCPFAWTNLADTGFLYRNAPEVYFDRADVKKAMNAPLNVTWELCRFLLGTKRQPFKGPDLDFAVGDPDGLGPVRSNDRSPAPIASVLPRVIEATNRVLISNGDWDGNLLTNGTLLNIQNMTWAGKMGFQQEPSDDFIVPIRDRAFPIGNGQGYMGTKHYERGLVWVATKQSGHVQPEDQPRAAIRHLRWVLGQIDEL